MMNYNTFWMQSIISKTEHKSIKQFLVILSPNLHGGVLVIYGDDDDDWISSTFVLEGCSTGSLRPKANIGQFFVISFTNIEIWGRGL